jgi:predicted transposase YdaD
MGPFEYLEGTAVNHLTLESLAKRVEALEKVIATKGLEQSRKDWRKVVGMFRESEFMREVNEECLRMREAEREAARRGESAE